jgi:hypothetical protein
MRYPCLINIISMMALISGCNGSDQDEILLVDCSTFESPVEAEERSQLLVPPSDLRDFRYCEVIPTFEYQGQYCTEVYNTLSFNDCPEPEWGNLSGSAILSQYDADEVFLNGPRHWVINGASGSGASLQGKIASFGGIQMILVATLSSAQGGILETGAPYTVKEVARNTIWTYDAGNEVYEIINDEDEVFIMQSYSRLILPNQSIDDLSNLGGVLQLPAGWNFRVRVLAETLELVADGRAVIIVDDFSNTYQKVQ